MRLTVDDRTVEAAPGDSVLTAMVRGGVVPGGCLCNAGDCPHCLVTIDGVAYVRACQTPADEGITARLQPADHHPDLPRRPSRTPGDLRSTTADVVVIGAGAAGTAEADRLRHQGERVVVFDAGAGAEVTGLYGGPAVVARTADGMIRCEAKEVVVATGAAEIQPVCPGNHLSGIFTARAASAMVAAGADLGRLVAVGTPPAEGTGHVAVEGDLVRFEGDGAVAAVVVRERDGTETRHPCDSVSVGLGLRPRDLIARMGAGLPVRTVGEAALPDHLPEPPVTGTVCPCSGVTVEDLESVWERGFGELDLVKRATLAGTGTCQGAVCVPHIRAFMAARGTQTTSSFTARPPARQMTMAEIAAGWSPPGFRTTALDGEHRALGAVMDRFGGWWRPWRYADVDAEYRAVRTAVSLGDVGTLGKMLVSGPDAVEFLERLYPGRVHDIRPGASRYALILAESGAVLDDGMICRDDETRFTLTFTSGGASMMEAWVRDWASSMRMNVHLLDRTHAWGAINVTGPSAGELLRRAGTGDLPPFMRHTRTTVADVPCRVFRLSFTGEVSYELHHPVEESVQLWRRLMDLGSDLGVTPHGIDTVFTLRLEKGHVIIGMDTEADSTPRRLGMDWAVDLDKPEFVGRQALLRTGRFALDRRLVGLTMPGPAPDEGAVIRNGDEFSGYVTSARFSPTLGHTVMLGWVRLVEGRPPTEVRIDDRVATVAPTPFYDPGGTRARA